MALQFTLHVLDHIPEVTVLTGDTVQSVVLAPDGVTHTTAKDGQKDHHSYERINYNVCHIFLVKLFVSMFK